MEKQDEEAKAKAIESQEIMEIDKEQINIFSIISKVTPENDLILCLAISKSAEESTSPTVEENFTDVISLYCHQEVFLPLLLKVQYG